MGGNAPTNLLIVLTLSLFVGYGLTYNLKIDINSSPAPSFKKDKDKAAIDYLVKYGYGYGYTKTLCSYDCGENQKKSMIKEFQSFAGIPVTGELDDPTIKQMQLPRCGKSDKKFKGFTGRRYRRYNPQGTVWKKVINKGEPLTWRYAKPPTEGDIDDGKTDDLSKSDVRILLKQAMKKWTDHTNVNFQEIDIGTPDLWIYFGKRNHGDPHHFDGPGYVLAHAFYPHTNRGLSGDMHFDDDELFTKGTSSGVNFLWVAVHELGHSLGLAHSNVRDAVMYPYYTGYRPNFQLEQDDIAGIQSLYGKKEKEEDTKPNCPITIKAMWMKGKSEPGTLTLVTARNSFYEVDENGNIKSSPPPVKGPIDAAFTAQLDGDSSDESTVIFSGSTYTVYTTNLMKKSGPHSIHKKRDDYRPLNPLQINIPSYVRNIDAAIKWQRNNKLYIFYSRNGKGYYRKYDLKTHKLIKRGRRTDFPISLWRFLPKSGVDAAVSWSGSTYFTSGGQIYKFNDRSVRVTVGYPKVFGDGGLLKCRKQEVR